MRIILMIVFLIFFHRSSFSMSEEQWLEAHFLDLIAKGKNPVADLARSYYLGRFEKMDENLGKVAHQKLQDEELRLMELVTIETNLLKNILSPDLIQKSLARPPSNLIDRILYGQLLQLQVHTSMLKLDYIALDSQIPYAFDFYESLPTQAPMVFMSLAGFRATLDWLVPSQSWKLRLKKLPFPELPENRPILCNLLLYSLIQVQHAEFSHPQLNPDILPSDSSIAYALRTLLLRDSYELLEPEEIRKHLSFGEQYLEHLNPSKWKKVQFSKLSHSLLAIQMAPNNKQSALHKLQTVLEAISMDSAFPHNQLLTGFAKLNVMKGGPRERVLLISSLQKMSQSTGQFQGTFAGYLNFVQANVTKKAGQTALFKAHLNRLKAIYQEDYGSAFGGRLLNLEEDLCAIESDTDCQKQIQRVRSASVCELQGERSSACLETKITAALNHLETSEHNLHLPTELTPKISILMDRLCQFKDLPICPKVKTFTDEWLLQGSPQRAMYKKILKGRLHSSLLKNNLNEARRVCQMLKASALPKQEAYFNKICGWFTNPVPLKPEDTELVENVPSPWDPPSRKWMASGNMGVPTEEFSTREVPVKMLIHMEPLQHEMAELRVVEMSVGEQIVVPGNPMGASLLEFTPDGLLKSLDFARQQTFIMQQIISEERAQDMGHSDQVAKMENNLKTGMQMLQSIQHHSSRSHSFSFALQPKEAQPPVIHIQGVLTQNCKKEGQIGFKLQGLQSDLLHPTLAFSIASLGIERKHATSFHKLEGTGCIEKNGGEIPQLKITQNLLLAGNLRGSPFPLISTMTVTENSRYTYLGEAEGEILRERAFRNSGY